MWYIDDDKGIGFRNGNFYYSVSGKPIGIVYYSMLQKHYEAYLITEEVRVLGFRGLQPYFNYKSVSGEFITRNQAVNALLDCYDPNKKIPIREYTSEASYRATNL